jgi:hypothetical protein
MPTLSFTATSCLLVTLFTGVSLAQTQRPSQTKSQTSMSATNRELLADAVPSGSAPSVRPDRLEIQTLFDPVPISSIPETPAASCVAPATSAASPTLPPAPEPVASTSSSTALPQSDMMLAAALARPVAPARPPDSRTRFVISNTAMYGATVFHAFGHQAEVDACKHESGFANGVFLKGSYKGQHAPTMSRFFSITMPIDAGVTLLSALARHKRWRSFEFAAPLSAATAHITAGAFKFSSGCY